MSKVCKIKKLYTLSSAFYLLWRIYYKIKGKFEWSVFITWKLSVLKEHKKKKVFLAENTKEII